jgi:hypothetical protein
MEVVLGLGVDGASAEDEFAAFDIDLKPIVAQYLMDTRLPLLEYGFRDSKLHYRYSQVRSDFVMPVDIKVEIKNNERGESVVVPELRLIPTIHWQSLDLSELMNQGMTGLPLVCGDEESDILNQYYLKLELNTNFYVGSLELNNLERVVEQ